MRGNPAYTEMAPGSLAAKRGLGRLRAARATIFDCDWTLLDVGKSYDKCIAKTVELVLARFSGEKGWHKLVTKQLIAAFRMSGGFNNDTDICFAMILAAGASGCLGASSRPEHEAFRAGEGRLPTATQRVAGESGFQGTLRPSCGRFLSNRVCALGDITKTRQFVLQVAQNATAEGIVSVERYLAKQGHGETVTNLKRHLAYPGLPASSLLSRVFDELFYGKELFFMQHGLAAQFNKAHGLISKDKLIVSEKTLAAISAMFEKRLSIVSGRSRLAAQYSLRPVARFFDMQASVFIEDEQARVFAGELTARVNKPGPYGLLKSMKAMKVKSALYVGDSAEDLIMAKRAGKGKTIAFCGVCGSGPGAPARRNFFSARGADAIVENVNALPRLLARVRR